MGCSEEDLLYVCISHVLEATGLLQCPDTFDPQNRVGSKAGGLPVNILGIQPQEPVSDAHGSPPQLRNGEVQAEHETGWPKKSEDFLHRLRFTDRGSVEIDVVQPAQERKAFQGVPGVEAPSAVGQNQTGMG